MERIVKNDMLRRVHQVTNSWLIHVVIVVVFWGAISGCDSDTTPTSSISKCQNVELNPHLNRVLYWGYVGPGDRRPNEGTPFSSIWSPVWIEEDCILTFTGTLINGENVRGLYKIHIDPTDFTFQSYSPFEFPHFINVVRYNSENGQILIVYNDGEGGTVSGVSLVNGMTATTSELVGKDWHPIGASWWPQHDGVVFYGINPQNDVAGFYWRYNGVASSSVDSLLFSVNLTSFAARNFCIDSDGKYLYSGVINNQRNTEFIRVDIASTNKEMSVVAERDGAFVSVACHPTDNGLILMSYQFWGDGRNVPCGHIELLNVLTKETDVLDIRTYRSICKYTVNENLSWSPDGGHFVFTEGAVSGEGGPYPFELWVYENVIR